MLQKWITEAGRQWMPEIEPFLEEAFSGIDLPSHDLQHHLRVWKNAAGLLELLERLHLDLNYDLVEGALIACMFHDVGLVKEPGALHGRMGREICEEFFTEKELKEPARYREMLMAIEHHDAKTANSYRIFENGRAPEILSILSVADDMDALGIIGIFRYAEIYLERGVALEELGLKILENAFTRRDNLLHCCRYLPGLSAKISREAAVLTEFWSRYNQQLQLENNPEKCTWAEVGIVNSIGNMGLEDKGKGHTLTTYFAELQKSMGAKRN